MMDARIVIAGESAMGRKVFDQVLSVGDEFNHGSGRLRVLSISHDPIPQSDEAQFLVGAERVS
jgi:hypothetical protein